MAAKRKPTETIKTGNKAYQKFSDELERQKEQARNAAECKMDWRDELAYTEQVQAQCTSVPLEQENWSGELRFLRQQVAMQEAAAAKIRSSEYDTLRMWYRINPHDPRILTSGHEDMLGFLLAELKRVKALHQRELTMTSFLCGAVGAAVALFVTWIAS